MKSVDSNSFQRWLVLAAALIILAACDTDGPSGPFDGGDNGTASDTSVLSFTLFTFKGYDADGTVETGLELQWRLGFGSTSGRDCRIREYKLTGSGGQILYLSSDPLIHFIEDRNSVSGKVRWLPLDGPTSAGRYTFSVQYETGNLIPDTEDRTAWEGPLSSGTIDTTFTVVP